MSRTRTGTLLAAMFLAMLCLSATASAEDAVNQSDGLAIHGYDPVAYFTEGRALEGAAEFETQWQDATWRFASQANLDLFVADPEAYAPQYGGYCAYAMAKGYLADIDPEAWTVYQDKLYLNYSKSVREQWNADRDRFIQQADANWPGILE